MTCYSPLKGWKSKTVGKNGKRQIVFRPSDGYIDLPIEVPCGKCLGCRLEYSRQWAIRCVHETMMHEQNCYLTLTYNDENLPGSYEKVKVENGKKKIVVYPPGSLVVEDVQKFLKRFRKHYGEIRFFCCGEYGSQNNRPHYHLLVFGFDFPDRELYSRNNGYPLFTSEKLAKLWEFGFSTIGDATWRSAAYIARYIIKKKYGLMAEDHYNGLKPEFTTMSRNPGLGTSFLDKYFENIYSTDSVVIDGKEFKPPHFYDMLLQEKDPKLWAKVRKKREEYLEKHSEDMTAKRLLVRERVKSLKVKRLKRSYENEHIENDV